MKIGIMGGTFNPIHNAHLALAYQALKDYKLDKIWFLPNGNPPHKENPSQDVTTEQRIEMIKLAIAGEISQHVSARSVLLYHRRRFTYCS